ncbi:MAG: hypothetical protein KDA42_02475 [Planctomycetales bacterium]|nr:hypothetical protein [Planctomycetales bacterium]
MPARLFVAVVSFLPFSLALVWLSVQAKKAYGRGDYPEAMRLVDRLYFYCNIALCLFFAPLVLALIGLAVVLLLGE